MSMFKPIRVAAATAALAGGAVVGALIALPTMSSAQTGTTAAESPPASADQAQDGSDTGVKRETGGRPAHCDEEGDGGGTGGGHPGTTEQADQGGDSSGS